MQAEPSRSEASDRGGLAEEGAEEGIWVPEEFLEHETAAQELADDAAVVDGGGERSGPGSGPGFRVKAGCEGAVARARVDDEAFLGGDDMGHTIMVMLHIAAAGLLVLVPAPGCRCSNCTLCSSLTCPSWLNDKDAHLSAYLVEYVAQHLL